MQNTPEEPFRERGIREGRLADARRDLHITGERKKSTLHIMMIGVVPSARHHWPVVIVAGFRVLYTHDLFSWSLSLPTSQPQNRASLPVAFYHLDKLYFFTLFRAAFALYPSLCLAQMWVSFSDARSREHLRAWRVSTKYVDKICGIRYFSH